MAGLRGKAREKQGVVTVKVLMTHPMEPGTRKNKETGKLIPPHYIEDVTFKVDDEVIYIANFGGAVAKDPYVSFKFKGSKGTNIDLEWKDNLGETEKARINVK